MVWNSTQSALYKAVQTFNGEGSEELFRVEKNDGAKHEKNARKNNEKTREKVCGNREKNRTEEPREKMPEPRCNIHGEKCTKNARQDPISRLLSDKDMLLIAGLIFVLMRENADKALILALAVVLLS